MKIFTIILVLLTLWSPTTVAQTNTTTTANEEISDSLWAVIQEIRADTLYRMLHKAVARIQEVEAKNLHAIDAFLLKHAELMSPDECQNMLLAEFESDIIKEYTMLQCARQQITDMFLMKHKDYFAEDAANRILFLRHCSRDD